MGSSRWAIVDELYSMPSQMCNAGNAQTVFDGVEKRTLAYQTVALRVISRMMINFGLFNFIYSLSAKNLLEKLLFAGSCSPARTICTTCTAG